MDQQTLKRILRELEGMESSRGLEMGELLDVSDELRRTLTWMVRKRRFEVKDLAKKIKLDNSAARQLINAMLRKGMLTITDAEDVEQYSTTMRFIPKYRVSEDIWKKLE